MYRKITADWVFPVDAAPLAEGVVIINAADGRVAGIASRADHDPATLEIHRGALVPGFVNTHCHLELSHLKGKIETGTGLIGFISKIVGERSATAEIIAAAVVAADAEMHKNGIVAVGDISNTTDTFLVKTSRTAMLYYTFVECFDLLQSERATATFEHYATVHAALNLEAGRRKSFVPHAPYSVSPELYNLLRRANAPQSTVSIHNQETPPENELFLHGTGDFLAFYRRLGLDIAPTFQPTARFSIFKSFEFLDPAQRTLFVHNTLTTADEIAAAHQWSDHVYWATCPNANLYIENRLPDYRAFLENNARVTIGTDSLSSNWQLSVLEEMKTIARYQSAIPFETLLRWATLNGAQALGFEENVGSIAVGKQCGLNVLVGLGANHELLPETRVQRLV